MIARKSSERPPGLSIIAPGIIFPRRLFNAFVKTLLFDSDCNVFKSFTGLKEVILNEAIQKNESRRDHLRISSGFRNGLHGHPDHRSRGVVVLYLGHGLHHRRADYMLGGMYPLPAVPATAVAVIRAEIISRR
jgi:hypothetical protein